jgi:uncharacterized protein (DUF58 family)
MLLFLSAMIYLLLFVGLAARSSEITALTIPLLVYLAAGIYFAPGEIKLKTARKISAERVSQGKPLSVELAVENAGGNLDEVWMEDLTTPPIEVIDGKNQRLLSLPKGGNLVIEHTLKGGRGEYRFENLATTANDFSGLFVVRSQTPAPARVLVYPEVVRLKRIHIRPPQTRGFAGPIPARTGGSGTDFFGIREYMPGDSPRRINWRISTLHEDQLFTNEFEQERLADVGLILDARQQSNVVVPQGSIFEHSVSATAALSKAFLDDGNRVSLLIYGFALTRVYPGYGKIQQDKILRGLARGKTGVNFALENLSYLPIRLFPPRSQLVVVSPLLESDLPAFVRLRAQGYEVLVVSPNPVEYEFQSYQPTEESMFALRLANMDREKQIRNLKKVGVRVVDWKVSEPLPKVIQRSLGAPLARLNLPRRGE